MQRLFLPAEQFEGDIAQIVGSDNLHLVRVLRMRVGERLILLDNRGSAWVAVLETVEKSASRARLEAPAPLPQEPRLRITVAQAMGKGDKLEQVIQHGVEIGASHFVPLETERGVVSFSPERAKEKLTRWSQIAKSAAEQSGRLFLPTVSAAMRFKDWATQAETPTLLLHTDPHAMTLRAYLEGLQSLPTCLTLAVGAEGGWTPAEAEFAKGFHIATVRLNTPVLRTETAALAAISQIRYHFEG